MLQLLGEAVEDLPKGWPEDVFDTEDDEAFLAGLPEDEREDYAATVEQEIFDGEIAESRLLATMALDGWGSFSAVAAAEVRAGLLNRPRAAFAAARRRAR